MPGTTPADDEILKKHILHHIAELLKKWNNRLCLSKGAYLTFSHNGVLVRTIVIPPIGSENETRNNANRMKDLLADAHWIFKTKQDRGVTASNFFIQGIDRNHIKNSFGEGEIIAKEAPVDTLVIYGGTVKRILSKYIEYEKGLSNLPNRESPGRQEQSLEAPPDKEILDSDEEFNSLKRALTAIDERTREFAAHNQAKKVKCESLLAAITTRKAHLAALEADNKSINKGIKSLAQQLKEQGFLAVRERVSEVEEVPGPSAVERNGADHSRSSIQSLLNPR